MPSAVQRWSEQLAEWSIPDHILARAPESPWVLSREVFVRRADRQLAAADFERQHTPTHAAVLDALAGAGTVLDVGAGAGAASLPCARAITQVTAVDTDAGLLAEFGARAPVSHRLVEGRWPDVDAAPADVVVCANVLYNVSDLPSFVKALTGHARRRVVVEIAGAHPLITLNPLWRHFHGVARPAGPTADDALAALRELGVDPLVVRWHKEVSPRPFDELVDDTRKRLCLPARRTGEVAGLLRGPRPSSRSMLTLSWPPGRDDQG
ncbi:MAG TPA: methyltransferase [Amycolatopsis sp.]|nr:methyltransferase [Amycolatopsis sp.]